MGGLDAAIHVFARWTMKDRVFQNKHCILAQLRKWEEPQWLLSCGSAEQTILRTN